MPDGSSSCGSKGGPMGKVFFIPCNPPIVQRSPTASSSSESSVEPPLRTPTSYIPSPLPRAEPSSLPPSLPRLGRGPTIMRGGPTIVPPNRRLVQVPQVVRPKSVLSSILNPALSVMIEYGSGNPQFRNMYNELRSEIHHRCPGTMIEGYGGRPNSFEVYINGKSRIYSKLEKGDLPPVKKLADMIERQYCTVSKQQSMLQMGGSGPPTSWGYNMRTEILEMDEEPSVRARYDPDAPERPPIIRRHRKE